MSHSHCKDNQWFQNGFNKSEKCAGLTTRLLLWKIKFGLNTGSTQYCWVGTVLIKERKNWIVYLCVLLSYLMRPYRENRYLQVLRNTVGLNSCLGLFALCQKIVFGLHTDRWCLYAYFRVKWKLSGNRAYGYSLRGHLKVVLPWATSSCIYAAFFHVLGWQTMEQSAIRNKNVGISFNIQEKLTVFSCQF